MMATDIDDYLRGLEKHGEDNVWRTAKQAREEIERLRAIIAERDARTCETCRYENSCSRFMLYYTQPSAKGVQVLFCSLWESLV